MTDCSLHMINPSPAFCARCQRCTDEGFMKSLPYNTKAKQFAKQPKPVVPKPRSVKAVKKLTQKERKPQVVSGIRWVPCETPGCTETVRRGTPGRQQRWCVFCAADRKREQSRVSMIGKRNKVTPHRGGKRRAPGP